jgi:hypothetical protein
MVLIVRSESCADSMLTADVVYDRVSGEVDGLDLPIRGEQLQEQ